MRKTRYDTSQTACATKAAVDKATDALGHINLIAPAATDLAVDSSGLNGS